MKRNTKKTNRLLNLVIDFIAGAIIAGIIACFLIGCPIGNPEEKTTITETTTVAITKSENSVNTVETTTITEVEETTTETITEVEETTTQVVETTTKEVVTVKPVVAPNLRAEAGSKYSDADVYLLAQIIYCEAGGVSRAEMARCGKVVLNRIKTDYWEFADCDTINEVLRYKNSYPQTAAKIDAGIKPSQDALEVAEGLLNGTLQVPEISEDVLWQTGFVPDWHAKVVYQSGCHYYSVYAG